MVLGRWIGGAAMLAASACWTDPTTADTVTGGIIDESTSLPPEPSDTSSSSTVGPNPSGGSNAESDGPHADPCPETHDCIPPAPESWLGPVALVHDETCPAPYAQLEADAFTQIEAAPARCSCTCDDVPLCGALVGSDLESACTFPSEIIDTTEFTEPDVCTPIPQIDGEGFHLAFEPSLGGECMPVETMVAPEPVPTDRVLACGAAVASEGCPADLVCVPRLVDDLVTAPCVMRTGDHDCPLGYPAAQRVFTAIEDDRGCSPCACTPPDGAASCDTTVRLSSTDDCSDELVPDDDVGAFACVPTDGLALTHLRFSAVDSFVTGCEPSGGLAVGTVEPAAPLTICCAG